MIQGIFQLWNDDQMDGEQFSKDFDDFAALQDWMRSQRGHPFLSFSLVSFIDHVDLGRTETCTLELTDDCDWDNWKSAK